MRRGNTRDQESLPAEVADAEVVTAAAAEEAILPPFAVVEAEVADDGVLACVVAAREDAEATEREVALAAVADRELALVRVAAAAWDTVRAPTDLRQTRAKFIERKGNS